MSEREKLRESLREHYDHQEFVIPENEWERASAHLDAARNKNRKRIVLFALLLLIGGASFFMINLISPKNLNTDLADNKSLSSPGNSEKRVNATGKNHTEVNNPKPLEGGIQKRSEADKKRVKENPEPQNSLVSTNNNHPAFSQFNSIDTTETETIKKVKTLEMANEPNLASPTQHQNQASMSTNEKGPLDDDKQEDRANSGTANFLPDETHKLVSLTSVDQMPSVSNSGLPLIISTGEIKINTQREPSFEAVAVKTPSADTEKGKTNTEQSGSANKDSVLAPLSSSCLGGEGIYYEAGLAAHYGWKKAGGREANGFSPLAGISYLNKISNHYALSFGVHYLQVNKLSVSSKTSRVSSYKYGEQSRVTTITPNTLHYLLAPIRLQHFINCHQTWGGGVNLAYLLNIDASVTSYDENPGFSGNYTTIKLSGYTQGFSWFDCQLALFYRHNLHHSFGLQAEVFLGLSDVKQDGFFGIDGKERNSGAKLSLVYYAFRKNK